MSAFEPGEVYMVTCKTPPTTFAAVRDHKGWNSLDPGIGFAPDSDVVGARPLALIDPENREQVERLMLAFAGERWGSETLEHLPGIVDDGQVALREFANPKPPKPAEPTGLGAVVEDSEGRKWTSTHRVAAWYHSDFGPYTYGEIEVVRVLSEGIS